MSNDLQEKLNEVQTELEGTKKRLEMLLDNIPGGVMEYDAETEKIGYVSEGLCNIFGCSEETFREHVMNSFELFVYKFDRAMVKEQIKNQTAFFDNVELSYRVRGLMDDIIWVSHKGRLYTDNKGRKKFLTVINDVTSEKLIQAELQRNTEQLYMETERLKLIEEAVDNTEFDYNVLTDVMETSEKDEKGRRRVVRYFTANSRLRDVVHPEDLPTCEALFNECLTKVKKGVVEYRVRERSVNPAGGERYVWYRMNYASFADKTDRIIRVIGSAKDISEEKARLESLEAKAFLDGMTGLYNKTSMQEKVEKYLESCDINSCHAMMMIDTDNFKAVNDNLGHDQGDEVIKFVAGTIKETFRESDFIGRMGGDEFMVFMKNTTRGITEDRAAKLNAAIKRKFENGGKTVDISCSIGISFYAKDGDDYQKLFKNADSALYEAKEAGKNCYRVYRQRK